MCVKVFLLVSTLCVLFFRCDSLDEEEPAALRTSPALWREVESHEQRAEIFLFHFSFLCFFTSASELKSFHQLKTDCIRGASETNMYGEFEGWSREEQKNDFFKWGFEWRTLVSSCRWPAFSAQSFKDSYRQTKQGLRSDIHNDKMYFYFQMYLRLSSDQSVLAVCPLYRTWLEGRSEADRKKHCAMKEETL